MDGSLISLVSIFTPGVAAGTPNAGITPEVGVLFGTFRFWFTSGNVNASFEEVTGEAIPGILDAEGAEDTALL